MLPDKRSEEVKRLKKIVENPDFKTEADVEMYFEAYTKYIWEYKMVGAIYDCYIDDIEIDIEGGELMVGVQSEFRNTLGMLNAFPDLKVHFIGIYCHKVSDDEFKFAQAVYFEATSLGPSKFGPPTGRKLGEDNLLEMCECLVKKVNGRWKIVDEWITESRKSVHSVMMGKDL